MPYFSIHINHGDIFSIAGRSFLLDFPLYHFLLKKEYLQSIHNPILIKVITLLFIFIILMNFIQKEEIIYNNNFKEELNNFKEFNNQQNNKLINKEKINNNNNKQLIKNNKLTFLEQEIQLLKKENKKLNKEYLDFIHSNNILKEENEKLKETIEKIQLKLNKNVEENKQNIIELSSLKKQLNYVKKKNSLLNTKDFKIIELLKYYNCYDLELLKKLLQKYYQKEITLEDFKNNKNECLIDKDLINIPYSVKNENLEKRNNKENTLKNEVFYHNNYDKNSLKNDYLVIKKIPRFEFIIEIF